MRHDDWRDTSPEARPGRRRDPVQDDYGQADYSNHYGYDPRSRSGYRAYDDGRGPDPGDPRMESVRRDAEPLSWREREDRDRAMRDRELRARTDSRERRDGPSDRVLWAVIMERLEDQRRLDLRDVRVEVQDGEVFLDGLVRHKTDKRRIEDIADIRGVRNVQNNLRVREDRRWTFI